MTQFHRTIAAVSPSGIHDPTRLTQSIELVESWGHKVVLAPNHGKTHLYTAGTQAERITDFRWAIEHPNIDTIWFVRGGYGTAQLLEHLPKSCSKAIIGFSDATALLAHGWNQKDHWTALLHGPVLYSLASLCDSQSQAHVKHWLSTNKTPTLSATYWFGPKVTIQAPMVGGNLCVLASLCGTPSQLNADGCILALEDIAEPLYKIDRMLLQLEQSGMLNKVKGIVFGSFHNCTPPKNADYTLRDVFIERLQHLSIPIYGDAEFGHNEVNWLWKMGQSMTLTPDQNR